MPIVMRNVFECKGRTLATSKVYSFTGSDIDSLRLVKEQRGLTDEDVDRLHITIIPAANTKAELGWKEETSLVKIPYFDINGGVLPDNRGEQLCRYRRMVVNPKGERYTQRKGTGSRHYLPLGIDWVQVAADTGVPVYYTEGEFKAITACMKLGPCIANAGVQAWRGPNGLAAPLDQFEWRGRTVYICYDADSVATKSVPLKSNIEQAQGELAVELRIRGATVKQLNIARTPLFKEGVKMGLDDYLLAGGSAEELLASATDPVVDEVLARMFQLYAIFVGTKPHIKQLVSGDVFTGREFADYVEVETRPVMGKPVKLANIYREHPNRNWFSQYVFDPSLPPGFLTDQHLYNLWRGFEVQPARSVNYERNVGNFIKFQSGVWGEGNVDYFLDWTAHLFQRPWELTTISPILVSRVKGIGKSLTGSIVRALIGTRSSFVGSIEGLTEKHTGELEGKIFVQVDEADSLFEGKENRLKALDSDEIRIRKMNTDGYTIKNILRKFYTTNETAPFRIASDERRYWIIRSAKGHKDGEVGAPWNTWIREVIVPLLKDDEALSDLMSFFMTRDISAWDPCAPVPRTEDMMDMVEAGETKKNVMADQLWEKLSPLGFWAVDSSISSLDSKLWGEMKSILKDNGGRTASLLYKDDGKVKRVTIYIVDPVGWWIEEDPKGAKLLAKAPHEGGKGLAASEVKDSLLKTRAVFDGVRSILGDKF